MGSKGYGNYGKPLLWSYGLHVLQISLNTWRRHWKKYRKELLSIVTTSSVEELLEAYTEELSPWNVINWLNWRPQRSHLMKGWRRDTDKDTDKNRYILWIHKSTHKWHLDMKHVIKHMIWLLQSMVILNRMHKTMVKT